MVDDNSQGAISDELQAVNIDGGGGDGKEVDADEDAMTPEEVLREMTQAFVNECASPKLLPHKFAHVDCLVDQVEHMETNLAQRLDRTQIRCSVHRMELYRINYVLNSYLRCRLQKIEANTAEILKEHNLLCAKRDRHDKAGEVLELLDDRELVFAEGLQKCTTALFQDAFLKLIPESMQEVPVPKSQLSRGRVFIEVLKEGLEDVAAPDMTDPNAEVIIQFDKGSRHLIPLSSVEALLDKDQVALM